MVWLWSLKTLLCFTLYLELPRWILCTLRILSWSHFNVSEMRLELFFKIIDNYSWKNSLYEVESAGINQSRRKHSILDLLKYGDSRENPKLGKRVCKTLNFWVLFSLYLNSTPTFYAALHLSDSKFIVYSALQTPQLGARMLIMKWTAPSQWQVRQYRACRGMSDRN